MKKISFTLLMAVMMLGLNLSAQEKNLPSGGEKFGNTLNIGAGIAYYGYIGASSPVLHANYEFDIAKNFTLAPFITVYTYRKDYYWGNHAHPSRYYYYRETIIPIGVKGSYYFDELFQAGSKWDFYAAASIGFAIRKTVWENGYYGDTRVREGASGLYLEGHLGSEYHINNKIGLFLDLSSGISTFGLALHL